MAACLAAPWPSQRGSGRSTSERHSALARMKERHARAERFSPEDEPPPRRAPRSSRHEDSYEDEPPPRVPRAPPQPRAPAQPRGGDQRPSARQCAAAGSPGDLGNSHAEPWAPAWCPESPRHMNLDDDSPPPKPRLPTPPDETSWKSRPARSEKTCDDSTARSARARGPAECDDSTGRSARVRGPAEVRTARNTEAEDEGLPPGVQKADFHTLQAMIARGIQDSETSAVTLEKDIPPLSSSAGDAEEQRYMERQRQRREQEDGKREKERDMAKQRRRREQEDRERRQAEELDREEREELSLREARSEAERQCRKELAAAVRIQARIRGCRSRVGKPSVVPRHVKAVVHWEPWMTERTEPQALMA